MSLLKLVALLALAVPIVVPPAQEDAFHTETVIPKFGKVVAVESDMELTKKTELKICFDAAKESRGKSINQTFDSAARFINLNVACGAAASNIHVAIGLHGGAAIDATNNEFYSASNDGRENPNADIIAELQRNNVTLYICGQTAAWRGINKANLLPGVKMAPSAMTAHVLLQKDGFALNPF